MHDSASHPADLIIGRSLITAETVAQELRERLARELSRNARRMNHQELLNLARGILADYEPIMAEIISNSDLAGWIAGYANAAEKLPEWAETLFRKPGGIPPTTPPIAFPGLFGEPSEPVLRFPLLEKAFESLQEREILTRDQFDLLEGDAKQRAFTIAGDLTTDTIEVIRDELVDDIQEGTSLRNFRKRVEERLETSPIGEGHLENVYRTNIQAAFRDGRETLASHPIVEEIFPYQMYVAIHDGRTEDNHLALESLGLSGTAVYRRDDPMWDFFTAPWRYQCRCGAILMTIEAAAREGVKEAQQWLETGQPPERPEWRLQHIPFRPEPGFGARGGRAA